MPGPSDIRVNPFNNATNYVNLTERHIVPSVSPFVVRLNEVPEKQDPSNMQMYYVDDTTGQTTETALTEVAATPGAGEFRPDYSTNAFDDTSWNTGLIEFSSADAGKIIEVSYTATGTLAGVKTNRYPGWWLGRGDGSDGDFIPESNVTISGEKNYTSVFIKSGVTVTINGVAILKTIGSFINNGTITADAQGAAGGSSISGVNTGNPGENGSSANGGAGGTGSQRAGGAGGIIDILGSNNPETGLIYTPTLIGAGGGSGGGTDRNSYASGAGGRGGGAIAIISKEFKNTGSISANGGAGGTQSATAYVGRGGGGGGGSVVVVADIIIDNGVISANGGAGGTGGNSSGYNGAAGDNGIIRKIELGVN